MSAQGMPHQLSTPRPRGFEHLNRCIYLSMHMRCGDEASLMLSVTESPAVTPLSLHPPAESQHLVPHHTTPSLFVY